MLRFAFVVGAVVVVVAVGVSGATLVMVSPLIPTLTATTTTMPTGAVVDLNKIDTCLDVEVFGLSVDVCDNTHTYAHISKKMKKNCDI